MVYLNPEAADHKDWEEGQSWVIYLFMEALYSQFKWAGIITDGLLLSQGRQKTFPALCHGERGLRDRWVEDWRTTEQEELCFCEQMPANMWIFFPETVNFLRLCRRSRTESQPRKDANSAAAGMFALKRLLIIIDKLLYHEAFTFPYFNTFNQDFNRMYLGGKSVYSSDSFGQANQTKMSSMFCLRSAFLCKLCYQPSFLVWQPSFVKDCIFNCLVV